MADFTGNSIQNTYQKVLQLDTGSIQDGLGNVVNIPTNQLSGSTLLSSSAQIASQISGSFNEMSEKRGRRSLKHQHKLHLLSWRKEKLPAM